MPMSMSMSVWIYRVKEKLSELGGGSPFPLFWQDLLTWEHTK